MTLLLDVEDDARVSAQLLTWHDPLSGCVCVHPTPATRSTTTLGHDVLAALGHPITRLGAEGLGGARSAWRAAAAWMNGDRIRHLVVLRADRLSAPGWIELLRTCRHTAARLTLVCHQGAIPLALRDVLPEAGSDLKVLHDVQDVMQHDATASTVTDRRPPSPALVVPEPGRPVRALAKVPHPVTWFRRRAFARLSAAMFARVDAEYTAAADATDQWLSHRERPGHEHVFMSQLVLDSPSRNHTLIRLRGYQAGSRRHGIIADIPPLPQLQVLGGPGLSGQPLTEPLLERIRENVAHPVVAAGLATILLTGMSSSALSIATWANLSPDEAGLRLERTRRSVPRVFSGPYPLAFAAAGFWVPPAARPLLRAARDFTTDHRGGQARMFPTDLLTPPQLAQAVQATGLKPSHLVTDLDRVWMSRQMYSRKVDPEHEDTKQFLADQSFTPGPCQESHRTTAV